MKFLNWIQRPFAWWLYAIAALCYMVLIPALIGFNVGLKSMGGWIIVSGIVGALLAVLAYKTRKDEKDEKR